MLILRDLQRIERERARSTFTTRYPTPGAFACAVAPQTTRQTPALEAIDRELAMVSSGENDRLMVFCPPQEGKSSRVACWYPLWLLAADPSLRIAIVSYSQGKAERWGKWIRRMIEGHPELGITLESGSRAAHRYETTAGGIVISVGIEGGITGEAVDCLGGDSIITTERGPVSIRELHDQSNPPRVLTLNHATGGTEWRRIQATRAIPDRPLVEVITTSGRRIVCTPDHRFHVPDGYRQAHLLRPGDRLTVGRPESDADLPRVWGSTQGHGPTVPQMLAEGACRSGNTDPDLFGVRHAIHADARGAGEGDPGRNGRDVLLPALSRRLQKNHRPGLHPMREPNWFEGPRAPVLHRPMQESGPDRPATGPDLRPLRRPVPAGQLPVDVLRQGLRGRRTLVTDDRQGQLPVQGRRELRPMVPAHAPADPGTGQPRLRSVRGDQPTDPRHPTRHHPRGEWSGRAPHQPPAAGQLAGEPDHALPDVPRDAPQVGHDTVSMVRELRGQRDTVYDLQVEGNHNFFAGEVLVHNCLIIDDPVRGRAEAESKTYRDKAWDWWESNAMTRASARFRVILMMTRFHADDLAGRLLKQEPGDWRVLRMPAIREEGEQVVRGNDGASVYNPNGELISVQGRAPGWFYRLRELRSAYVWRSVYAQSPVSAEGNLFRKADFRYWYPLRNRVGMSGPMAGIRIQLGQADEQYRMLSEMMRFITIDLAASVKTSADWSVAAVWGLTGDGQLILLDQERQRLEEADHFGMVRPLAERWMVSKVYVERGFIGTTLVIDATRAGLHVYPLTPDKDKITRAIPATNRVRQGRVWLPATADWMGDWLSELAEFPLGEHDDRVDCLAYAARVMAAHWLEPEVKPTPREHQLPRSVAQDAYTSAIGTGVIPDLSSAAW